MIVWNLPSRVKLRAERPPIAWFETVTFDENCRNCPQPAFRSHLNQCQARNKLGNDNTCCSAGSSCRHRRVTREINGHGRGRRACKHNIRDQASELHGDDVVYNEDDCDFSTRDVLHSFIDSWPFFASLAPREGIVAKRKGCRS